MPFTNAEISLPEPPSLPRSATCGQGWKSGCSPDRTFLPQIPAETSRNLINFLGKLRLLGREATPLDVTQVAGDDDSGGWARCGEGFAPARRKLAAP